MVRRLTGLFLVVVVVVVTMLAAPALTATPAAALPFHLTRGLDGVRQLLQGEADAPLVRVDADDEQGQLVPDAHELVGTADRTIGHLRDVQQAIDAGLELDKSAEVREADNLARDPRAH